jgi:phosphohistidine phosphatase
MTLTLILMRHAKSGWDDPAMDDIDRPLSERGRRQAPLMGQWLATRGHHPDVALVSTAARTRETWDLIAPYLPDTRVEHRKNLYLAPRGALIRAPEGQKARSVLILAHNPGIAEAAHDLVRHRPDDGAFLRYPTAATSVIRFDAPEWNEIGRGELLDFTVPARLE